MDDNKEFNQNNTEMNDTIFDKIEEVDLKRTMETSYIDYAMSVIASRALPDVRDGLKPVQRRVLFSMSELNNTPDKPHRKCARIVGDTMGKYHPHGDSSIYGALVNMAQDWSTRYPLVDGHGNFGSEDGDGAAAMRYTEARLSKISMEMLADIGKDTVDFVPNFDETEKEPTVLPARYPNLLANGTTGIAVGMATNIPPHNLAEVSDALLLLIENPDVGIEQLVRKIKGPDFPTGGVIVDKFETILKNYQEGKGAFRIRAKWEKEDLGHGQYQIVITEIPYQVIKSKLIERIAQLLMEKKIPMLSDIRDESAQDVRIVLEPKTRLVDANLLMEYLFKQTELEVKFNMNFNVLDFEGVPRVLDIKQVLRQFLDNRYSVLKRRVNYRMSKILARLEILSGYLTAYLNLDEIVRIIREEDDVKAVMMETFNLSENLGKLLENQVFVELLHRGYDTEKTLFYYHSRNDKETDFVLREGNKVKELIQVCYDMSKEKTIKREVDSIVECAGELGCDNLTIVTWNEQRTIEKKGYTIKVVPVGKF